MIPAETAAVLEAVPLPLVLIGPDRKVLAVNALARPLFGSAAPGRHIATFLRQPEVLEGIERALATSAPQTADWSARDGTYRVTASPLDGGVVLGFQETGAEQAAGAMRRDFVANVSHELRSPLTAMLGFIETLRGAARDDAAARDRFLTIMEGEAARMARLIEDLLSLSRVEANEKRRPTALVDLAHVAHRAKSMLDPSASEAGKQLLLDGADQPLELPGDADQLMQVLSNLIENALKYGGTTVTIGLQTTSRDPDMRGPAARLTVADDGPGIESWHLPRLTERFYRADAHRSREQGGTGLGLAIVKHIVNRHRGRLRIESTPGQGTRVTITLPMQKIDP